MSVIFNVFQPGLIYGSETNEFDGIKRDYAYVEHPIEGWRVFLRVCVFIHEAGRVFDPLRFLVVKRRGTSPSSMSWEPPKGRAEGKDMKNNNVLDLLGITAIRETQEESHILHLKSLLHTGYAFQSQEMDYRPNVFFQYHIFQVFVEPTEIAHADQKFTWISEHPRAFARFRPERREKDDLAWFDPKRTRLCKRWAPSIVSMYIQSQS